MPYTPPIDRRELQKSGIFDEDKFYKYLSDSWNYMDPGSARFMYLSFVRLVSKKLRSDGVFRLPHLGDFALVKQKPRGRLPGKPGYSEKPEYVLKFYPSDSLREYFNKLQHTKGLNLDPREKILNQKL